MQRLGLSLLCAFMRHTHKRTHKGQTWEDAEVGVLVAPVGGTAHGVDASVVLGGGCADEGAVTRD